MHDGGAALLLALYILSSKLMLVKMWTVLILKRCQMYLKHEFLFFYFSDGKMEEDMTFMNVYLALKMK